MPGRQTHKQKMLVPLKYTEETKRKAAKMLTTVTATVGAISSEAGHISIDRFVRATNLVDSMRRKRVALPDYIEQYLETLDFHKIEVGINLRPKDGIRVRGIKKLLIELELKGKDIKVNDLGPETIWKPKPYSATIEVGIDGVGDVIKLIPVSGIPTPNVDFKFKYAWNPKIATVVAGKAGSGLSWTFNRDETDGTYLDGGHTLVILFERPRNLKKVALEVKKVAIKFDRIGLDGEAEMVQNKKIRVEMNDRITKP